MKKIPDQSKEVADAIFILGNTLRVGILRALGGGPKSRAEIASALDVTSGAMSSQIQLLEDHGLVTTKVMRAAGRPIMHALNTKKLKRFEDALLGYLHSSD